MSMNVLMDFSYSKRYFLTHPWKWFKEIWTNIKNGWMRATKGYCYTDVWNIDNWFCEVLPPMLRHMANHGCAHPGVAPFETEEKWHDWLHSMADVIDTIYDEDFWVETKNEYYKEWNTLWDFHNNKHPNFTETCEYNTSEEHFDLVRELYYARMKEISEERQELINDTFMEIARAFDYLWD